MQRYVHFWKSFNAKFFFSYGQLKSWVLFHKKEFEDTKGVIRIRKSKQDRQHNGQKKNNNLQNIHIKLM